jgi:hypothetical protein
VASALFEFYSIATAKCTLSMLGIKILLERTKEQWGFIGSVDMSFSRVTYLLEVDIFLYSSH